jgi:hypothetical protein
LGDNLYGKETHEALDLASGGWRLASIAAIAFTSLA